MIDVARESKIDPLYSKLLNETEPLPVGSALYVENLYFDPSDDIKIEIARDIRLSTGGSCRYFTGHRGTGKSTELLRLQALLQAQGKKAYYVDLVDYLVGGEPPDVRGFLAIVAASFAQVVDEDFGVDFRKTSPAKRLWAFLSTTEVAPTEIGAGTVKAKVSNSTGFLAAFMEATKNDPTKWMAEARSIIGEMTDYVTKKTGGNTPVILFDSFERLRPKSPDAEKSFFGQIAELFNAFEQLRFPGLHVVYSVPPYLPVISNIRNNVRLHVLGSVRVFEYDQRRAPRKTGIDQMLVLLDKRYPQWREVLSDDVARELAEKSGGDIRIFLRQLMLETVNDIYSASESLPIQKGSLIVANQIATQTAFANELLYESHVPILRAIVESRMAVVEDTDARAIAARLFDERLLLNYSNGKPWVDANPLLWDRLAVAPPAAPT